MKNRILFQWFSVLIIGLALCYFSVAYAQNSSKQSAHQLSTNSAKDNAEIVITLERRTDYFKVAPEYKVQIYADGSVIFIGQRNVKTEGAAKGSISKQELRRLIRAFEEINYFSLGAFYNQSDCPFYFNDAPTVKTELNLNGRRKSIVHDLGCSERKGKDELLSYPRGLTELENLIDAVVKSENWIEDVRPKADSKN
ncbi:MAG: DUF6438 domain-containing protein [Acidobacteriota bacterium]|nr:DUF6438 domain-containing protein [Acidobacteriota bacterium]